MLAGQFNEKYKQYIEQGFGGLEFNYPEITKYLDGMMEDLTKIEGFTLKQIKLKFAHGRFYTNLTELLGKVGLIIQKEIEDKITNMYQNSFSK